MSGWVAGIGAGGALLSGALNLYGQSKQQESQGSALQMAMQDYQLRKRMADQQYELATAGQQDARGNKTRYVPGQGWVTDLTPQSQSMVNRSDAVQGQQYVDSIGRGASERSSAFNRRLSEGSAANPLLDAMRYGYGAPSRAGVGGANRIANVTGASEGADQARGGYNAAALRTGSGSAPLESTIAGIDRGATTGIRSALARGDADEGALFQQMMDQFNAGKLNPYNQLASRASNIENMPFNPESISGGIDAMGSMRAKGAGDAASKGAQFMYGSMNPLMTAMLSQRSPNYDTFVGGLTDNLKNIAKPTGIRNYGGLSEDAMNRIIGGGGLYT